MAGSQNLLNVNPSGQASVIGSVAITNASLAVDLTIADYVSVTQSGGFITTQGSVFQANAPWTVTGSVRQLTDPWTILGSAQLTNTLPLPTTGSVTTYGVGSILVSGTPAFVGSVAVTSSAALSVTEVGSVRQVNLPWIVTGSIQPYSPLGVGSVMLSGTGTVAGSVAITSSTALDVSAGSIRISGTVPVSIAATVSVFATNTILTVRPSQIDNNGTISANGGTVNFSAIGGRGGTTIAITGTWVGTLEFEVSPADDSLTFVSVNGAALTTGALATSTTSNGTWRFSTVGMNSIRVRASAWTSGTATIRFEITTTPSVFSLENSLPTGTNTIGTVNIGGVGSFYGTGVGSFYAHSLERAMYYAAAQPGVAANKHLMSIYNSGPNATNVVRIREIVMSAFIGAAVIGLTVNGTIIRNQSGLPISGAAATIISGAPMDYNDAASPSNVIIFTGGSMVLGSVINGFAYNTEETVSNPTAVIYEWKPGLRPLTLRPNQGISLVQSALASAGSLTISIKYTNE